MGIEPRLRTIGRETNCIDEVILNGPHSSYASFTLTLTALPALTTILPILFLYLNTVAVTAGTFEP